jgi:hypothetical protein
MVDCGMCEYFDQADQSNSARQWQFDYGSSTPLPAEICPKMHFTKQSRRSFAPPNPTNPSHQDVKCGVVVEHPRWFSIILPSGFVRGHGLMMMRCTGIIVYKQLFSLGWEFRFLVPISEIHFGSGIPDPLPIPKIPDGKF